MHSQSIKQLIANIAKIFYVQPIYVRQLAFRFAIHLHILPFTPPPRPSRIIVSITATMAFVATPHLLPSPTSSVPQLCRQQPHMGPWRSGEKDAAYEQQQEILKRRRDKRRNKEYFDNVQQRRNAREASFQEKRLVVQQGEDPLVPWKKLKEKGLIDDAGYGEEDQGGIPIPMASFGIPKYDNGGRFDLKLPHVEHGYTDDDADVMGKAGQAFKKFFGFDAKEERK